MADTATVAAPAAPAKTEAPKDVPGAAAAKPDAEATEVVKVNGKELRLTKAQLIQAAQKGLFADQKLQSLNVLQGKTTALLQALKTPEGLLGVLKDPALGASPKEVLRKLMTSDVIDDELKEDIARWTYENVVQKAKLSPAEVERDKKLAKLEQMEKAESDRKARELSDQQKAQVQQVYQAVRAEVTKQIVADKTFPQTEGAVRQVIEKLRVMNKKGAPINAESVGKALDLVKKDYLLHQQAILDADDDAEALIARIGEARALKISKALIARLRKKTDTKTPAAAPEGEARQKVTDRIDNKLGRTKHGFYVMDVDKAH